jgi:tRNA G18 (ribose-2'-O)-methylase SpoU
VLIPLNCHNGDQSDLAAAMHRYPELADYVNLTDVQLRMAGLSGANAHFVAESEGVVRQLIASGHVLRSLLITEQRAAQRMADVLSALPESLPVFVASASVMESITGFHFHRGVLASALVGKEPSLDSILTSSDLLVVCEGLSNIENIGAVFRNTACLAWGRAAIVRSADCCHPLYRKSLRVSMGHALSIPYVTVADLPATLAKAAQAGFTTLAMTPRHDAIDLKSGINITIPGFKPAIVLGAEGPGLTSQTINACSCAVKIPMAPGTDSLNVATALAVALSWLRPM